MPIYPDNKGAAGSSSSGVVSGSTDNAILRADGTGGSTSQGSLVTIDDSGNISIPNNTSLNNNGGSIVNINSGDYTINNTNGTTVFYTTNSEAATVNVKPVSASKVPLLIKDASSPTADSMQIQPNGSTTPIFAVNQDGIVTTAGNKRVNTNVTNATSTVSNIADLTINVQASKKYSGMFRFVAKNSTAAEGIKFDFGGGTATVTSVQFYFMATPPGVTLGTVASTALTTAITATTATTTDVVYTVYFDVVVNAAGTLIPRFAEVSHTSGTATVEAGSTSDLGLYQ